MAFVPDYRAYSPTAADGAVIDAGLRGYMLRVYNWMASGLVLTGAIAYGVANTSLINLFYHQVMTPRGVAGLWPARREGDDVVVLAPSPLRGEGRGGG